MAGKKRSKIAVVDLDRVRVTAREKQELKPKQPFTWRLGVTIPVIKAQ